MASEAPSREDRRVRPARLRTAAVGIVLLLGGGLAGCGDPDDDGGGGGGYVAVQDTIDPAGAGTP